MSDVQQATVQVVSVTSKAVGAEKKTMWTVRDGNGTEYTTFIAGRGNAALQYEGRSARIEWTEKQNGQYTNRYLEKIEPAQEQDVVQQAEPVDWDNKERRNFRSRAWAQAISAFPSKEGETPRDYFIRVKPMAQAIFQDVCGDFATEPPKGISGAELGLPVDDVPF